jgi:2-polyprenyl-6-methoxyphenol hydroxylase-like FAD-dependent oxidoreductase
METDVLVVGAGPVGLMMAAELRRHDVRCRIIDKLTEPAPYCKAIGIQPRTLEIWEQLGIAGRSSCRSELDWCGGHLTRHCL